MGVVTVNRGLGSGTVVCLVDEDTGISFLEYDAVNGVVTIPAGMNVNIEGTLKVGGVAVTAGAADLNVTTDLGDTA
jgi:hypothetical protein